MSASLSNVSLGTYIQMVSAASNNNWVDRSNIIFEILISMKRAGASAIISYHALEIAEKINKNV